MFRMFKAAVITKSGMTRPFLSKYRAQRTAHCAVPAQHTDTSPGVRCCVMWATAAPGRTGALRGAGGHQPTALQNGPSMGPSSCCSLPLSAQWYAARGYGTGLAYTNKTRPPAAPRVIRGADGLVRSAGVGVWGWRLVGWRLRRGGGGPYVRAGKPPKVAFFCPVTF